MGCQRFSRAVKKVRNALFLFVFFIFHDVSAEERPKIIASIPPLGLLIQDLAGQNVDLGVLLSNGASPHDFSLTIGQVMSLQEADILVWVGPETEPYLAEKRLKVKGLAMSSSGEKEQHSDHHSHISRHPWLGLDHVREFLPVLHNTLKSHLSSKQNVLDQRYDRLIEELMALESELKREYANVAGAKFVVYHDAYGEFVDQFDLPEPFALTHVPHEQLSVKKVAELHATMGDAACMITETGEAQAAKRYADLLGLSLVEVDLLASSRDYASYADYLRDVGRAFSRCFAKK